MESMRDGAASENPPQLPSTSRIAAATLPSSRPGKHGREIGVQRLRSPRSAQIKGDGRQRSGMRIVAVAHLRPCRTVHSSRMPPDRRACPQTSLAMVGAGPSMTTTATRASPFRHPLAAEDAAPWNRVTNRRCRIRRQQPHRRKVTAGQLFDGGSVDG